MNVVWFAEIKWDYLRTRKQQLIHRRTPGLEILFLEPYARGRENRFDLRSTDGIRVVTIPFIKSIPSGPARRALDLPLARRLVDVPARARVRENLRRAGIDPGEATFIISNVFAIDVAASFPARRLVYDCNDAHADFPGMPSWTRLYQEKTFRSADRVIVSGRRLRDDATYVRDSERDIFLVGNGVDYDAFSRGAGLRTRDASVRPRIGYLGAVAPWLDFDLLIEFAQARPSWELALVGPVLPGAGPALERLSALSNVKIHPAVPHEQVPQVLAGFDVGLIPFRSNTLTAGVNPNKLYEYLATGLPVVATPFSPDVVAEDDVLALAGDAGGFVRACEAMLSARRDGAGRVQLEARARAGAAAHDWNRIAGEFWAIACG